MQNVLYKVLFLLVLNLLCIYTLQKRLLFGFKYINHKLYKIIQNYNKSLLFLLTHLNKCLKLHTHEMRVCDVLFIIHYFV